MKLSDLQHQFQAGLLKPTQPSETDNSADLAIFQQVNTSEKEQKDILFGVYQEAYRLRLIEFLQTDYELLELYLGDAGFEEMALGYLQAYTSTHYNARWFGGQLPAFLARQQPWSDLPQLTELAAFDLALLTSFDAQDAPIFAAEQMALVEDWAGLVLKPQPAVGRLNLKTNAYDIREALSEDVQPPEMSLLEQPQQWLFYRNADLQSMYRLLAYDEAMMWDEMAKGVNFSGLCAMLAHYSSEEQAPVQAAGYLQGWINDGLLCAK